MHFKTNLAVLIAVAMICSSAGSAFAQRGGEGRRERRGRGGGGMGEAIANRTTNPDYTSINGKANNGPAAGTEAPDFSLTPIKFYDFKTEEQDITLENADVLYENVRLSDFRDKKPVALIFGSYT